MEGGLSLAITGGLISLKASSPHTKNSHQPCVQVPTASVAGGFLEFALGPRRKILTLSQAFSGSERARCHDGRCALPSAESALFLLLV